MGEVAEAAQLMKQALEILDARGEHQTAGMLDLAIQRLPGDDRPAGAENADHPGDVPTQP